MNRNRFLSSTLAFTIVLGSVSIPNICAYAKTDSGSQKEEVVYIMTNGNGDVDSVNVVNIFGKGDITDYGNYSSVKMLTSTEPISQDGDTISFTSDTDRIYYQGTLENAQIPWNIDISYSLDGKEISPDELAGKSGALEIKIKITDNTACKNDYYDNYALQAAVTLDTDLCKNITADGATSANVGSDKQLSYTILPGKGLDATISADVTDFEMDAITINGIKLDLNVEIDDAELMDKVSEIMDAAKSINDGAEAVNDGTSKLSDGGDALSDGVSTLYSATGTLDNGIASLNQGVATLQTGLNTLNSKSGDLTNGSSQVKDALATIQSGLAGVSMSTDQLAQLTSSSSAIKQGISDLYDGAVSLQANLSYQSYKAAMSNGGLDIDQLQAGNTAAIASLSEQITGLETSLGQLQAQMEQLKNTNPAYEGSEAYAMQAAQVAQLETQIESLKNVVTLLTGNNAAISGTEVYLNTVSSGVDTLVSGLSELKTNYDTFDAAIVTLTSTLSDLTVNMSSLKSGIDLLVSNYSSLDSGITEYTDGVATIVAGYSDLVNGTSSLASGSKELLSGTGSLKDATAALCDGIDTLYDGTSELYDGTDEFYDKTSTMDTQVEDSIDEMISSISGDDSEPVSFVSDKNTNVQSVQFVIKTSAIEKPEAEEEEAPAENTSFWAKLKNLF